MASRSTKETSQTMLHSLTSEWMRRLLSLIEPTWIGYEKLSGKGVWIFDIGAPRHMTGNLDFLNQVKNINLVPVELSEGVFWVAKLQGNMDMGLNIKLSNAL